MAKDELLQNTIEKLWDTLPPVWKRIRGNARCNAIQDYNLTLIQFHILRHIQHGIHSVGELAKKQQISRPAISQALEPLVQKSYVIRLPSEKDRRYIRLELTESAQQLLETVFAKNRHWMAERMVSLNDADLETILTAMDILKKAFDPEQS